MDQLSAARRLQAAERARQARRRDLELSATAEMAAAFADISSSDSDTESSDDDSGEEEIHTCLNHFGDPPSDDDFGPWDYSDGEEIDYM
jgi:hypothetical protein